MTFSFAALHRSAAYWSVLGLAAAANAWSFAAPRLGEPACCDSVTATGFPFPFYLAGGIAGEERWLVTGLLLDLVVAWTLAVIAAWIGLAWRRRGR